MSTTYYLYVPDYEGVEGECMVSTANMQRIREALMATGVADLETPEPTNWPEPPVGYWDRQEAGELSEADWAYQESVNAVAATPGSEGRIPLWKLTSPEWWTVTSEEARIIRDALLGAATGPDFGSEGDQRLLRGFAAFCTLASSLSGFTVTDQPATGEGEPGYRLTG